MFIWAMPVSFLRWKSVTIMTYKAEGSVLVSYLDRLFCPFIIEKDDIKKQAFREKAVQLIDLQDIPAISGKKSKPTLLILVNRWNEKQSYCSKIVQSLKNLRGRQLEG